VNRRLWLGSNPARLPNLNDAGALSLIAMDLLALREISVFRDPGGGRVAALGLF
jgi:hypothetical protein